MERRSARVAVGTAAVILAISVACLVLSRRGDSDGSERDAGPHGDAHSNGSTASTHGLDGAPPPDLQGRTSRKKPPGPIYGVVQLAESGSPTDAEVYLIPKGEAGLEAPSSHVRPDAEGQWDLGLIDPTGSWIGAVADGYAPTFLDGDTWDGGELALKLKRGRTVQVSLRSSDWPVPTGALVQANSIPWFGSTYPGPLGSRQFEVESMFAPSGTATLSLPTAGSVHVVVNAPGFQTDPGHLDLKPDQREAIFDLIPMCLVDVEVTDAKTGWTLEHDALIEIHDLETGRSLLDQDSLDAIDVHHFMDWMLVCGVLPGRYSIKIRCEGYESFVAEEVHLRKPGHRVTVDAALRLAPKAGRLQIQLVLAESSALLADALHMRLRRSTEPTAREEPWRWVHARSSDLALGSVRLEPLKPGRYHLLVWAGPHAVGHTEVTVEGGQVDTATVVLDRGLTVDMVRSPNADLKRTGGTEYIRLAMRSGGSLPVMRYGSLQPRVEKSEADVDPSPIVPGDAVLGPYPFDEILVIEGSEDTEKRWVVTPGR